jgi:hypothetical protein
LATHNVTVGRGPTWTAGALSKLLEARYVVSTGNIPRNYDVSADGRRFLMLKAAGGDASMPPPQVVLVQHFEEELKRLVPSE